jgi:hypothetical protein
MNTSKLVNTKPAFVTKVVIVHASAQPLLPMFELVIVLVSLSPGDVKDFVVGYILHIFLNLNIHYI